jgi:hypothetical protein
LYQPVLPAGAERRLPIGGAIRVKRSRFVFFFEVTERRFDQIAA